MARRNRKPRHRNIHLYVLEAILVTVMVIEGYKFIRFVMDDNAGPSHQYSAPASNP